MVNNIGCKRNKGSEMAAASKRRDYATCLMFPRSNLKKESLTMAAVTKQHNQARYNQSTLENQWLQHTQRSRRSISFLGCFVLIRDRRS